MSKIKDEHIHFNKSKVSPLDESVDVKKSLKSLEKATENSSQKVSMETIVTHRFYSKRHKLSLFVLVTVDRHGIFKN